MNAMFSCCQQFSHFTRRVFIEVVLLLSNSPKRKTFWRQQIIFCCVFRLRSLLLKVEIHHHRESEWEIIEINPEKIQRQPQEKPAEVSTANPRNEKFAQRVYEVDPTAKGWELNASAKQSLTTESRAVISFRKQQSPRVHFNEKSLDCHQFSILIKLSNLLWEMDDQPKEGGEGDKKIVHVYPLVKVSCWLHRDWSFDSATITIVTDYSRLPLTCLYANYQSCDKARNGKKPSRGKTWSGGDARIACVNIILDQVLHKTKLVWLNFMRANNLSNQVAIHQFAVPSSFSEILFYRYWS